MNSPSLCLHMMNFLLSKKRERKWRVLDLDMNMCLCVVSNYMSSDNAEVVAILLQLMAEHIQLQDEQNLGERLSQ
jgi:hypothetical protein